MTHEEIQAVRVRCAEIDGWKKDPEKAFADVGYWVNTQCEFVLGLPDYTGSIDAINAAVIRLSEARQRDWVWVLGQLKSPVCRTEFAIQVYIATASALDRARAFVAIHD